MKKGKPMIKKVKEAEEIPVGFSVLEPVHRDFLCYGYFRMPIMPLGFGEYKTMSGHPAHGKRTLHGFFNFYIRKQSIRKRFWNVFGLRYWSARMARPLTIFS